MTVTTKVTKTLKCDGCQNSSPLDEEKPILCVSVGHRYDEGDSHGVCMDLCEGCMKNVRLLLGLKQS